MNTIRRFVLSATILLAGLGANAATRMVSSNESIQAAINAAASGDVIWVQGGIYGETLAINGKALAIRAFNGGLVEVQAVNVTNAPAACTLSELRVLMDINATASAISVTKCNVIGSINVTKGELNLVKSTIGANVTVSDPVNDASEELEAVIVQSTITERLVCKAKRSWTCYNVIRHGYFEGDAEITGNEFNGRGNFLGIGIDANGTTTYARIRNNRIFNYSINTNNAISEVCIGIRIKGGAKVDVVNNIIFDCKDDGGGSPATDCGMGIFVQSTSGTKILGNVIWSCKANANVRGNRLVYAPFAKVVLKHNVLWPNNADANLVDGGVENIDNLTADPKFVNTNNDHHLQTISSAKNAGPSQAQYNDRDGTRNDMGMYGGHSYVPDGRTTNKPIAVGLKAAPLFVPAGGIITIQSTGATQK